ncbi:protein ORF58 [Lake sturgeon herpesvirus]|nr:protein ORF58 [Lake sturgeon herpesvirus]
MGSMVKKRSRSLIPTSSITRWKTQSLKRPKATCASLRLTPRSTLSPQCHAGYGQSSPGANGLNRPVIDTWTRPSTAFGPSTSLGWTPQTHIFLNGNFVSHTHGCSPAFFTATQHVNIVYNKKQQTSVFAPHLLPHKQIQSGTVLTDNNKFVTDKKKTFSVQGVKNTRIEFTSLKNRSSNYTTNCRPLYQPAFQQFFELTGLCHGETSVTMSAMVVNNVNYTTCLYGLTNPFSFNFKICKDHKKFHNTLFFPSVNLYKQAKGRQHQIFESRYINSQKIYPGDVNQFGFYLQTVVAQTEYDPCLNWYFCRHFEATKSFLNTPNKTLILWFNERFYLAHPQVDIADPASYWPAYVTFMDLCVTPHLNHFIGFFSSGFGQYHNKNPEFIHLIPFLIFGAARGHNQGLDLIASYAHRLSRLQRHESLLELRLILQIAVELLKNPQITLCDDPVRGMELSYPQSDDPDNDREKRAKKRRLVVVTKPLCPPATVVRPLAGHQQSLVKKIQVYCQTCRRG